ncbi:MAG: ABC transporter ATP-binding protein, partial [Trebonia sp.]
VGGNAAPVRRRPPLPAGRLGDEVSEAGTKSMEGTMSITVEGLTKRYGGVTAVEGLTFDVAPGLVTGFLGPNGAGKTTTLRMLLGLVTPTEGRALIGGRPYSGLAAPRTAVGAVLEATGFHPGRRGRDHLRVIAQAAGLPRTRADEVLDRVGLSGAGSRRVRGYSLGMRQRLGLAAALLGDPRVLVLDEPANGLDPAGMAQLRDLLRDLAAEGRTILMSSHVLSEVAQTVDRVVIIAGGTLRYAGPLTELTAVRGETLEAAFLRLTSGTEIAAHA